MKIPYILILLMLGLSECYLISMEKQNPSEQIINPLVQKGAKKRRRKKKNLEFNQEWTILANSINEERDAAQFKQTKTSTCSDQGWTKINKSPAKQPPSTQALLTASIEQRQTSPWNVWGWFFSRQSCSTLSMTSTQLNDFEPIE